MRGELLILLQRNSVFEGDFTLASGAKSQYYVDCKLTTLTPQGAWLVGRIMHDLIREKEKAIDTRIDSIGGLTMGADPIALAIGMVSHWEQDPVPLPVFSVRKQSKDHGQTKRIEGCFHRGDTVVIIDDVITKAESTWQAIQAVEAEGGQVAFVASLVDREEGGRASLEAKGYSVLSVFTLDEILSKE